MLALLRRCRGGCGRSSRRGSVAGDVPPERAWRGGLRGAIVRGMRRGLALLATAGGVAVLFASAARPTHVVRHSRVVGSSYCIETTASVPAMPPYKPQEAVTTCG